MKSYPNGKPIHIKPNIFVSIYQSIHEMCIDYGYYAIIHGSLINDFDLYLIRIVDNAKTNLQVLQAIDALINNKIQETEIDYQMKLIPGNCKYFKIPFHDTYLDIKIPQN